MQTCPGSIVLVSDAPDILTALREIFRESGWYMREARAISELPQLFNERSPSVILTDDFLPDGGWLDVLAMAGAICPEARILVTGKLSDYALWAEVLNRGGFDVLAQPLDSVEVLRVASSALLSSHWKAGRAS